ncbi:PDR/VanB family oxidoreductase [Rhodococcus ruber]|uniref:PDR/VanB family oxidoreductase n=1 Tax=Rhodococcus ruber TaxID=1830 RepID=UPI00265E5F28|nr:PDR/VanB family oxidoreductase [Rhodococcus ruber]MDO1481856.1 oxidoreductase [Rhodococcus ruber]
MVGVQFDDMLVVEEVEQLHKDVIALQLVHPRGLTLPQWTPGAHIDIVLKPELVRQYSLCGDLKDQSRWTVAVQRCDNGLGSSYIHSNIRPGNEIRVRGPRNHFELEEAPRLLFIAGGVGITPILPMLAQATAWGADWRLVYVGRRHSDMPFIAKLWPYGDRVMCHGTEHDGPINLEDLINGVDLSTMVYCCGPERMLDAIESIGAASGHRIRTERFQPCSQPTDGSKTAFEIELAQSNKILSVSETETILDVLEGAGVQVLSSCRTGTCGTCEVPVLAGVPDHRDNVLTVDEHAANDAILVCVSRSCTPRLVLDC